jgi:hypothetical protein
MLYHIRKFRNMLKAYIKKRKKIDKESSRELFASPNASMNLSSSFDISLEDNKSFDNSYNLSREK